MSPPSHLIGAEFVKDLFWSRIRWEGGLVEATKNKDFVCGRYELRDDRYLEPFILKSCWLANLLAGTAVYPSPAMANWSAIPKPVLQFFS